MKVCVVIYILKKLYPWMYVNLISGIANIAQNPANYNI